MPHREPFQRPANGTPAPERFAYEPTAMQKEPFVHDTPKSWPVLAIGFGLGAIAHPRPDALAGVAGATTIIAANHAATHLLMAIPPR